jgi:lysophospholipase L1-like esterase
MKRSILFFIAPALILFLTSCTSVGNSANPKKLTGVVIEKHPLVNAQIILRDSNGNKRTTTSDSNGEYQFSLEGITAPVTLSAVSNHNEQDCLNNTKLRPVCMASFISSFPKRSPTIANINPLTDRIVSDIAVSKGFIGPQQWVMQSENFIVKDETLQKAFNLMRSSFYSALKLASVDDPNSFNPASFSIKPNDKLASLFSLIHHNRNYDNNTGAPGHTTLTDISFRPIVGLMANGAYEPFDLSRARKELDQIERAGIRIFIVGDSTSAVYEQLRYPRMGWGQKFEEQFNADAGIKVVVGSRAGRSSRDFYNGRWFAQMENFIKPGDYIFINHGHNDQNCNSAKPIRGTADVTNLCTYPNDANGKPQFPAGSSELSFQHSLERYIRIARERGAHPVLFTPTTRILDKDGRQTTPVISSHITRQNDQQGYGFTGNYIQTIKDTARVNKVPLIDLEAASIEFANHLEAPDWKNYWLVVDPALNSFYANGIAGSTQAPDGTHFQEKGAAAMAKLVATEIKKNPKLFSLGAHLIP